MQVRDRSCKRWTCCCSSYSPLEWHTRASPVHKQQLQCKVKKVQQPTISSAESREEWSYIHTRWKDCIKATKLKGKDMAIQLLKFCREQLRKDITRNAGGSLINKFCGQGDDSSRKKIAVREENTVWSCATPQHASHPEDYGALGYNVHVQAYHPSVENNSYLCHGWYRLPELPAISDLMPWPTCMQRWPDPGDNAHVCSKLQWSKDTWCHHLEIHWQIPSR